MQCAMTGQDLTLDDAVRSCRYVLTIHVVLCCLPITLGLSTSNTPQTPLSQGSARF